MNDGRSEFRPFGVECRARHCRIAFLVDLEKSPLDLIDSLIETNYGLWGGRFNPIVPVQNGNISEAFWKLLTYVDPDIVYSYAKLNQETIDRLEREIVPWEIRAHPSHLIESPPHPHYIPTFLSDPVKSREVLPLIMSRRGFVPPPALLTYFHEWKTPLNDSLVRLVQRNFGIIQERSFPGVPEEWSRLQVPNNWTPIDLMHALAVTRNTVLPFQASATYSTALRPIDEAREEYSIVVGRHH
jgi:hypothetical protein